MEDDDEVQVQVKVPVMVTVTAPRRLSEASTRDDLREIVDSVIQRDFPVRINTKGEYVHCIVGPSWDELPDEEMECVSTESGSWGER